MKRILSMLVAVIAVTMFSQTESQACGKLFGRLQNRFASKGSTCGGCSTCSNTATVAAPPVVTTSLPSPMPAKIVVSNVPQSAVVIPTSSYPSIASAAGCATGRVVSSPFVAAKSFRTGFVGSLTKSRITGGTCPGGNCPR